MVYKNTIRACREVVGRVWHDRRVLSFLCIVVRVVSDLIGWFGLTLLPRRSLEVEILLLRRQLALYVERGGKPRRLDGCTSILVGAASP